MKFFRKTFSFNSTSTLSISFYSMLTSILIIPIIPTVSLGFSGFGNGNPVFELGGFIASEGKTQNIGIQNLVGNTYTTTNGNNGNVIVGVGYLFNGPQNNLFGVDYGLDAFYLAPSLVKGQVWQEQAFDNLNYSYKVTNIPAYALTKLNIKTHSKKYNITVDAGVGPNFVITSNYQETPNNSEAIPDNAFSGHTQINFSAMIGLGLKINHVFGNEPLECGYRFFYLGQGDLSKNNSQILNNLETSNGYAHAVTCSITL